MESGGEDLDDIFEEHENTENDTGANSTETGQNSNETSNAIKLAPPKRIVRNPRLKFNPERLCGERGIPIIVDHFKNVKFKGVGHEKDDLDKLLSKLEHWTHRLFPSMKFEECLVHIEKLGKKRPVQTCLRKMRLDMPILNSDFVKDDDEDDVRRNDDAKLEEVDAFDRLIEESQNVLNPVESSAENVHEMSSSYSPPRSNAAEGHVLGSSFGSSLTDEQKERMERNRMLAAERRKARLAALQHNSLESQSVLQETAPSQSISTTQSSFDMVLNSSLKNQECTRNIDDECMEISHEDNANEKSGSLELNNDDSENLGLEDLIDLVDEEDPIPDKNSATSETLDIASNNEDETVRFSQNNNQERNSEQNNNSHVLDNAENEVTLVLRTSETTNNENLGIESLLNLVDDNSEDCQQNSDPSCLMKNTTEKSIILNSDKELITIDCEDENSEIIETEKL